MMTMRIFLILILSILAGQLSAQADFYDQLKIDYDRLRKEEKHDSALVIAKQMNAWAINNTNDTSLIYLESNNLVGVSFYDNDLFESAKGCFERSIQLISQSNSHDLIRLDTILGESCSNLANTYFGLNDYVKSEKYGLMSLEIYERHLGRYHLYCAILLENISMYKEYQNDNTNAIYYLQRAEEIYRCHYPERAGEYFDLMFRLAKLYYSNGEDDLAKKLFLRANDFAETNLPHDSKRLIEAFIWYGSIHYDLNDFASSEKFYKKAVDISIANYGKESKEYIDAVYYLIGLYRDYGNPFDCYGLMEEAIVNSKIINGYLSYEYAEHALITGLGYLDCGDYFNAEKLLNESFDMVFMDSIKYSDLQIDVLLGRANLYSEIGNYDKSQASMLEAMDLINMSSGMRSMAYAEALNSYAHLCFDQGQYKKSEAMYLEVLDLLKRIDDIDNWCYASALIGLSNLKLEIYSYQSAFEFANKACGYYANLYGEYSDSYANALNILGLTYSKLNDLESSALCYKKSLAIVDSIYGHESEQSFWILVSIGVLFSDAGGYDFALKYYHEAECIFEMKMHEDIGALANLKYNIGMAYMLSERLDIAADYFQSASVLYGRIFGDMHPDCINNMNMLSKSFYKIGQIDSAFIYYDRTFQLSLRKLSEAISWMSADQIQNYWSESKDFYLDLINFCTLEQEFDVQLVDVAFKVILFSKSLLLETSRELDQAIAESADDEMKTQFAMMKQLSRTYNKIESEGASDRDSIKRYKAMSDSLDKILVTKLGEYAASKRKFEITWKDIQSNLTPLEAAIEFARYYDDDDSSHKYMALVVRPGYEHPRLVKLAPETDIKNALAVKDFALLYELVWQGIDTLLTGVNTAYYSPVGELNNIAFSALCFEAGDSLKAAMSAANRGILIGTEETAVRSCNAVLMDKYTLHQLTTTRYLADGTLNKDRPLNSSITLLGGINYDDVPKVDNVIEREESEQDFALNVNLTDLNVKKGSRRSSSGVGKPMKYLEGTREEVTHIATQLDGSWSVQIMSDRQAAEHGLKSQLESSSPGVLHIATHGFAFPDVKRDDSEELMMDEKPSYSISEDPMVRCGLMLSGSNISWTGNAKRMIEQTGDDGILTAAEVSNLDLSGTKLVVLSACETGLGKIEGSEGTFGLKRGFKLAGVEQMIVSLWSVPDKETMELMTLFYTDLTKTLNPVQSFEKTQKQMRNQYPTQPDKWAGFVLLR
jgi:tetratricopeptide (TPR) repeat protein